MKRTLLFFLILMLPKAHAGVFLLIEHPRNPSHQKDLYTILCEKKCDVEIKSQNPAKGVADTAVFESKIKNLIESVPVPAKKILTHILYKIEVKEGNRKTEVILGYPMSYKGEEFRKYGSLIAKIEDIKTSMREYLSESN